MSTQVAPRCLALIPYVPPFDASIDDQPGVVELPVDPEDVFQDDTLFFDLWVKRSEITRIYRLMDRCYLSACGLSLIKAAQHGKWGRARHVDMLCGRNNIPIAIYAVGTVEDIGYGYGVDRPTHSRLQLDFVRLKDHIALWDLLEKVSSASAKQAQAPQVPYRLNATRFGAFPRVFDGTIRVRPKPKMAELAFESVKKGDLVLVEVHCIRDAVGSFWTTTFCMLSVTVIVRAPEEQ